MSAKLRATILTADQRLQAAERRAYWWRLVAGLEAAFIAGIVSAALWVRVHS